MDFIATMKTHVSNFISISITFYWLFLIKDFKAIGIDKRGFILKLEKEVKKLPTPELKTNIPVSTELYVYNFYISM